MNEIIIANATIVDPEKDQPFAGSIVIRGTKIDRIIPGMLASEERNALVAELRSFSGSDPLVIDAAGLAASPGFIDIHSHSEGDVPCAEKSLAQGVTTAISGNCGFSAFDVASFLADQDEKGYPIHQAEYIGHSATLREKAGVPTPYVAATNRQIDAMKVFARAALEGGACGISFGIQYAPGTSMEELRELLSVAGTRGKIAAIHTRLNHPNDFDSLRETIELASQTGTRLLVSHLAYMYADGRMDEALALIGDYRSRGVDVWADSGMYTAFQTIAGTPCFDDDHIADYGWKYSNFFAASGRYAGRYLDRESFFDIRHNSPKDSLICFTGVEEDIYTALKYPGVMVSSDSGRNQIGRGHPHGAGNFARFFRVMVRERKDVSLIEGVRKCTLYPANAMKLKTKGRLAPGSDADIVLFDPSTIRETADFPGFGNPDSPPEGVPYVLVAGQLAIERSKRLTGAMAGQSIKYQ